MSVAISCVWCGKPLVDVEHAKKHVAEQCEVAPWRKQIAELQATITRLRSDLAAYQHPLVAAGKAQSANEVIAENARQGELVRRLADALRFFVGDVNDYADYRQGQWWCEECGQQEREGHASDCALHLALESSAALLAESDNSALHQLGGSQP